MKRRNDQSGMSLIEVMIAAAISVAILLGFAQFTASQSRSNHAMTEKLGAMDASRTALVALTNRTKCSGIFNASNYVRPSDMPFNPTLVSASHPKIVQIKAVPSTDLLIGTSASPLARTLVVSNMQMEIISATSARLRVQFDPAQSVIALNDLVFDDIEILGTGTATSETITGCGTPPEIVMCLSGCGGLWPNQLGGIALYNWSSHDNTNYYARGTNCSTNMAWLLDQPGGAGHAGAITANGLYLCGQ